ncbi:MAG TPA: bifunctional UDP-sugar hydrolase/5'-nucleotidase [Deltaproteobacteria bacterium]|nr:bifunctional UDP-sugar hydrolase/5'-nucleotidase [Deltaproteobacteria bacterium]
MRTGKWIVLAGIALLLCTASSCKWTNVTITILQTSDVHHHASGYGPFLDYTPLDTTDSDSVTGGYARLATLIKQIREEQARRCIPTLVVDSGDFLMGTVYDLTASNPIALQYFTSLQYDAVTLGNHEFDWSPSGLALLLSNGLSNGFNVPVVATNTVIPADSPLNMLKTAGVIQNTKVIEYPHGVKVGIIGLMGPDADTKAPVAKPVTFNHDYAFIQAQVDDLRNNKGVHMVIALSHGGVEKDGTGEDVDLANNVRGIDVICSGHFHTDTDDAIVAGPSKTIIFSPGEYGENLSRIDVTYNVFSKKIVCFKYKSIPVDDSVPGDPATQAMVEAYHAEINANIAPYTLAGPVSKTGFALELAALTETGLGDLAADSLRATATGLAQLTGGDPCDFSVVASGVVRDNLYPGSTGYITFADAYNVLPLGISPDPTQGVPGYPLMSLYVTAPDLRNICEAALTIAPNIGSDYYLNFSGLSVEFDPTMAPYYQGVRSVSLYPVNDIPCMNDAGLVPIIDLDAPYVSTGLYHCVVDLYALQMMNVVTDMGLTIIPRDEFGVEIDPADYMSHRIDARPDLAGVQELKEWMALLQYLGTAFPASGAGIPELVYGDSGLALGRIIINL